MHTNHKRDRNFVFSIVFILLGLTLAIQFRSVFITNSQKLASVNSITRLREQAKDYSQRIEEMKNKVSENEKKVDEYLKSAVDENQSNYLNTLYETLEDVKLKAGLVDVKGPGIVIQMNDAAEVPESNILGGNDVLSRYIIHDWMLKNVLNELVNAGAQAISVEGERIMPTSNVFCAGPTIKINQNRYAVPFEIQAIGDPDVLYDQLSNSSVFIDMLERGLRVSINKSGEVKIPGYLGGRIENLTSAMEVAEDEIK